MSEVSLTMRQWMRLWLWAEQLSCRDTEISMIRAAPCQYSMYSTDWRPKATSIDDWPWPVLSTGPQACWCNCAILNKYIYICTCMYVCMYVFACIYVCMYVCKYVCMYVCIYVFMYDMLLCFLLNFSVALSNPGLWQTWCWSCCSS